MLCSIYDGLHSPMRSNIEKDRNKINQRILHSFEHVGPSQPALECPADRYVTLTDEKQSVDMEWGVNSDLECTPSVFDEEGTYEILCIKGFQTCEFEFQVYVKKGKSSGLI